MVFTASLLDVQHLKGLVWRLHSAHRPASNGIASTLEWLYW